MALTENGAGAFPQAASQTGHRRRYDLDWLRVIAFALLIFYHVGMFYVTWGWHVKSVHASHAAEPLMLLLNPWRLALLFFISGVAIRFASDKLGAGRFAAERVWRLGVPIVFGMAVVVAPQTYFQLCEAGEIAPGFFAFWPDYLNFAQKFSVITPTWNHLWYVVYLLVYVLLLAPVLPFLRRFADGAGGRAFGALLGGPLRLLLVVPLPFIVYRFTLDGAFPTTHDLVNDWANHAHRFTILLIGYFAAKNARFWDAVDRALPWALGAALVLGAGLTVAWMNFDAVAENSVALFVARVLRIVYAWMVIAALLGLAQRFLNRPSPALTYLTEAVFPYYIPHQTIIVAVGYALTRRGLGAWSEFALVLGATLVGCAVLTEIIRRVPPLRPLFGMKLKRGSAPARAARHSAVLR